MKALMFGLAAFVAAGTANAQGLPKIHVIDFDLDDGTTSCQLEAKSAQNAAKAALRYNGVELGTVDDVVNGKALGLNLDIMGTEVSNSCAVDVHLDLRSLEYLKSRVTTKKVLTTLVYCERTSFLTGSKATIQTRLNDVIKEHVDSCLSEYEELPVQN